MLEIEQLLRIWAFACAVLSASSLSHSCGLGCLSTSDHGGLYIPRAPSPDGPGARLSSKMPQDVVAGTAPSGAQLPTAVGLVIAIACRKVRFTQSTQRHEGVVFCTVGLSRVQGEERSFV